MPTALARTMNDRRNVLTPEALSMMDAIARSGSFAAAARQLGKVPSALTYSVRQLEDALDVLLFDRRSRHARLTAAGQELLEEGRRLLQEMDAVADRVCGVGDGWETQLSIAADDILSQRALFDRVEAFYALRSDTSRAEGPGTRLRMSSFVTTGAWQALVGGQADLAIGVLTPHPGPDVIELRPMGSVRFVFAVAPHHPLAAQTEPVAQAELVRHRTVVVAGPAVSAAHSGITALPGQDVLTVPTTQAQLEAQLRGLACGFLPEPWVRAHVEAGRLAVRSTDRGTIAMPLHYAWRAEGGVRKPGRALRWWLAQLENVSVQRALVDDPDEPSHR